jgi:acetylornithine aminotransferase
MVKEDIVRAANCYLYDTNDKKYVDFESGVWCTALGHGHPRIQTLIEEQLKSVTHLGYRYTNHLAEEAAVSLLETVDIPDGKCVFLSSGSEAVELSVQIAKLVTGKRMLLTLSDSYLAAYGTAGRQGADDWISIDFDGRVTCEAKNHTETKDILFDQIAAFVLEPGSAFGTVKFPPQKLVDSLVKEIKQHNGLVVIDEVTTGLGRTGRWYGFNHYQLQPDVIACGKGLGNGYPVSAIAMGHDIAEKLEKREFHYVQSHQNDPLACAIAKEVINVIKEEGLIQRSSDLGSYLLSCFREMKNSCEFIKDVRGRGLMVSIKLSGNMDRSPSSTHVYHKMLERGFLVGYNPQRNVVRFLPPLTIEEKEITNLVKHLECVLEQTIKNRVD